MKKIISLTVSAMLLCSVSLKAQFGVLDKVKNKVNDRANQKVDKGIDKGLDKGEDGTKKNDPNPDNNNSSSNNASNSTSGQNNTATSEESPKKDLVAYGKYDFVPGDKIIFEDHVDGETLGEFPSRWDLRGGKIEIASINGEQVIAFLDGNYSSITPLMEKPSDYLPEQFSIEFDHYVKAGGYDNMAIAFFDHRNSAFNNDQLGEYTGWCIASGKTGAILAASGPYPDQRGYSDKWHHIAISFNKGNVKIYTDQYRLCNLPRSTGNPQQMVFGCIGSDQSPIYIKNIRIAAGGGDLYKRVASDGKFVTHGILFDVNKSTIKPQSMGTLNDIARMLKDHPELKFEIDGHTDSDGDDAANLKLSQARSEAVKEQLIQMGVDASRLTTKGYGKTKPIDNNTTAEGKANNRRVEFVKI